MNKFRNAAIEVLQEADEPLHYREITKRALESGLLKTSGRTPHATISSLITTDINTKGAASTFLRTGNGIYTLTTPQHTSATSTHTEEDKEAEGESATSAEEYRKKAGEHLVCSQLLLQGLNTSITSVSSGINVVALRGEKMFGICVVTPPIGELGEYTTTVCMPLVEGLGKGGVFYTFVLLGDKRTRFLIIPLHEMEKKIHEKAVVELEEGKRYQVSIRVRGEKIYFSTKEHQMGYYLDNWNIIT